MCWQAGCLLQSGLKCRVIQVHPIGLVNLYLDVNGWVSGLEIRGSNGSKCYHVFSFATRMLIW